MRPPRLSALRQHPAAACDPPVQRDLVETDLPPDAHNHPGREKVFAHEFVDARGPLVGDDEALVGALNSARDDEYSEILDRCRDFHAELEREREAGKFTFAELEENEEDLAKLEAWFGKVRARDRFGAPLVEEAEREVGACREDLEDFARSVFEAADHGSAGPGTP